MSEELRFGVAGARYENVEYDPEREGIVQVRTVEPSMSRRKEYRTIDSSVFDTGRAAFNVVYTLRQFTKTLRFQFGVPRDEAQLLGQRAQGPPIHAVQAHRNRRRPIPMTVGELESEGQ